MSLIKSSTRFFKQNYQLYLPVLVILYVFTILRIPTEEGNQFSLLGLILQIGYLYFLVGFMKLVVSNNNTSQLSVKNIFPNIKTIIRPVATLVSLVVAMMVIYLPFVLLIASSFIKNITNNIMPKEAIYSMFPVILVFIILVLLTSFILNSTLLFSIKNNTWPMRSVKDFFKSVKGRFFKTFGKIMLLTFYMLCIVMVMALLFTLVTIGFGSEYISMVILLAVFQLTIFPVYYICFTKIVLPIDNENHNLPEIQPLEVNPPVEIDSVGQNI